MMTPADLKLLEQYIDGTLADGDLQRLRALRRDSAEARAMLRSLATIDFGLQDIAATADADSCGSLREPIEDENTDTILSERTPIPWKSRTTKFMIALLAVAVLIIIALSVTLYFQRPSTKRPVHEITVRQANGAFAGRFQTIRPADEFRSGQDFDVLLHLQDFRLDPSLDEMKDKLPSVPFGLVVESVWCHTLDKQAGLEISEVELAPAMEDASK